MAGYYIDPVTTGIVYTPGVQLIGGQGGAGQVALTARTGRVALLSDASVYSGSDLTISQPNGFALNQTNTLQAAGTLSVEAAGRIDNAGTIVGGTVALGFGRRYFPWSSITNRPEPCMAVSRCRSVPWPAWPTPYSSSHRVTNGGTRRCAELQHQ